MEEQKKKNKLKYVILILALLLGLSLVAHGAILLYDHFARTDPATTEVPGNIITPEGEGTGGETTPPLTVPETTEPPVSSDPGETTVPPTGEPVTTPPATEDPTTTPPETDPPKTDSPKTDPSETDPPESGTPADTTGSGISAAVLSLYSRRPSDNESFRVTNLFPGDRETQYYCVRVSYKADVTIRFRADIRPGYERLAEVLKVQVRLPETGTLLYDGLMRDMPEALDFTLKTQTSTQSDLYYEITVSLETSVGNAYQNQSLMADFQWWAEDEEDLDSPPTGDTTNLYPLFFLAGGSLLFLVILLGKRRKEADDD